MTSATVAVVLAAAVMALVTMSCATAVSAQEACVWQTPSVFVFGRTPTVDVSSPSNFTRQLRVGVFANGAKAGAIRMQYSSKLGVVVVPVTEWSLREESGNSYTYQLSKVFTPLDPSGEYTLDELVYTDITGQDVVITSFDKASTSFLLTNSLQNPQLLPPPALLSFVPSKTAADLQAGNTPFSFTFSVDLPAYTTLGLLSVTYRCPSKPSEELTFTTNSARQVSTANGRTRWDGSFATTLHRGTFACVYALGFVQSETVAASIQISDSSIQSMRFPTPITDSSVVPLNRLQLIGLSDNLPPASLAVAVSTTFVNSTEADTYFTLNFTVADASELAPSGIASIEFRGSFPVTPVTLTSANIVGSAGGLEVFSYAVVVPQGFPSATWTFQSKIKVTDYARNSREFDAPSTAVSVACGQVHVHHIDERDLGDSSLNGIVALLFILTAAMLAGCFYLVRRQRQKYEFDPNADIPAVPSKADYQTDVEIGADASGNGNGNGGKEQEQSQTREHRPVAFAAHTPSAYSRAPSVARYGSSEAAPAPAPAPAASASAVPAGVRDAVAEMAAAREAERAERARQEAAAAAAAATAVTQPEAEAEAEPAGVELASTAAGEATPAAAAADDGQAAAPAASDALPPAANDDLTGLSVEQSSPTTAAASAAASAAQPDLL